MLVRWLGPWLIACMASVAAAQSFTLLTEDYPPFNYVENGRLKGSSVEQVERIMKDSGLAYKIEIRPWARALARAETEPATCVFTTAHTRDRHDRFKWVEPILSDRVVLVRKAGADVRAATIAEATQYIVGTQRADFTADILAQKNFGKIDLASDLDLTLRKLLNGRIDMMPIALRYFNKLRRENVAIERVIDLADAFYGLACNPAVADAHIERMRKSLDRMIADGTQAALFRKYGLDVGGQ
jgi:polar amino acid transport system substrate-binding protein